jgi:hypothetical protein
LAQVGSFFNFRTWNLSDVYTLIVFPCIHAKWISSIIDTARPEIASNVLAEKRDLCRRVTNEKENHMSRLLVSAIVIVTVLTAQQLVAANLFVNGDFESGNTGFTTDYSFAVLNIGSEAEGQYGIGSSPQAFNQNFATNAGDHTTGFGNMMFVNASPQADSVVWSQSVAVRQNANYTLEGWVMTLYPASPANLSFTINGAQVGNNFIASFSSGVWLPFSVNWNSAGSTSALIQITDTNTQGSGNDFALDDLSFNGPAVPEPSSSILISGAALFAIARRRRSWTRRT